MRWSVSRRPYTRTMCIAAKSVQCFHSGDPSGVFRFLFWPPLESFRCSIGSLAGVRFKYQATTERNRKKTLGAEPVTTSSDNSIRLPLTCEAVDYLIGRSSAKWSRIGFTGTAQAIEEAIRAARGSPSSACADAPGRCPCRPTAKSCRN